MSSIKSLSGKLDMSMTNENGDPVVIVSGISDEKDKQSNGVDNEDDTPLSGIFSKVETDADGNSVVTIRIPKEYTTVATTPNAKIANGNTCKIVKQEEKISGPWRGDTRLPIWKREIPKQPASVSNYLYPHSTVKQFNRSRVIIDCPTNIPARLFKSQLNDTSDTITTLDVAPSTKRKVKELTTNSVSKLFAYPGRKLPNKKVFTLFQRHLTVTQQSHELEPDLPLPPLNSEMLESVKRRKMDVFKEIPLPIPAMSYKKEPKINSYSSPHSSKQNIPVSENIKPEIKTETKNNVEPEINSEIKNIEENVTISEVSADTNIIESVLILSDNSVKIVIKAGVMAPDAQELLIMNENNEAYTEETLQQSLQTIIEAVQKGQLVAEDDEIEKTGENIDELDSMDIKIKTDEQIIIVNDELNSVLQ